MLNIAKSNNEKITPYDYENMIKKQIFKKAKP